MFRGLHAFLFISRLTPCFGGLVAQQDELFVCWISERLVLHYATLWPRMQLCSTFSLRPMAGASVVMTSLKIVTSPSAVVVWQRDGSGKTVLLAHFSVTDRGAALVFDSAAQVPPLLHVCLVAGVGVMASHSDGSLALYGRTAMREEPKPAGLPDRGVVLWAAPDGSMLCAGTGVLSARPQLHKVALIRPNGQETWSVEVRPHDELRFPGARSSGLYIRLLGQGGKEEKNSFCFHKARAVAVAVASGAVLCVADGRELLPALPTARIAGPRDVLLFLCDENTREFVGRARCWQPVALQQHVAHVELDLSESGQDKPMLLETHLARADELAGLEQELGVKTFRPSVSALDMLVLRGVLYLALDHHKEVTRDPSSYSFVPSPFFQDLRCLVVATELATGKRLWESALGRDHPCRCRTHRVALYAQASRLM